MGLFTNEYGLTSLTDPVSAPEVSKPSSSRGYVGDGSSVSKTEADGGMGKLPAVIASRLPAPGSRETMYRDDGLPSLQSVTPTRTPPSLTATRVPSRTPTSSNEKVPMSCQCTNSSGQLSIPHVIKLLGARQPTGLAKDIVLPAFMAEGAMPATGAALDLIATAGTVWTRDANVQRVLSGQFQSRLWGAYIATIVVSVSGIQEMLDTGTADNIELEATWRSFVLTITPRNSAPIQYTLLGGVGIPRHGTGYGLAAGAAVGPLQGPETFCLPSPVTFNATDVEVAQLDYTPNALAISQAALNTGSCYVNAYFGGIMWKNDGSVIPPESAECKPSDFTAPMRYGAGSLFNVTR